MAEGPGSPVDVYSDQMGVTVGPFGCALNFSQSLAVPPAGGAIGAGYPVATVRMSLEHLKIMVFLLRRQVVQHERNSGVQIPIPREVLNQMRIGLEDWKECWGADAR
jgi:hypothetical protein